MRRPDASSLTPSRARRIVSVGFLLLASLAWAAPVAAQTNLGTWSIGEFEDPLYINPGPLSYNPADGPLPPGLAFRSDAPPWASPGSTGTIAGVATTPGTYNFTLRNSGAPQAFTMRIAALAQKEWNAPDASVGVFYSYQLGALNASGAATFAVTGTNAVNMPPPGMTLSSSGVLAGTPTTSGFYNIWYSIHDSVDTIFKSVSINVYDVRVVTDGALPNGTQNAPYTTSIVAAGGTGPYTFTVSNSQNLTNLGLTLSSDGVLSGTPTFSGKTSLDITATDAHGISRVKRFALSSLSSPPGLLSINNYGPFLEGCPFGTPCSGRGISVGGGRAPYSWTVAGLPLGMDFRFGSSTLWWITPGDLELWGAPTQLGTFPITVTVTDGDGQTASTTFDFNVSPLWLWQYMFSGTLGTPYSQTFRVLGGRPPYTATLVNSRMPLGLNFNGSALNISGTPQETGGFTEVIDFRDADLVLEHTAHFPSFGSTTSTIFLNSGDDLGTIQEGTFYSNQLQACCVPSYKWSIASGSLPTGLALSPSGLLSGTIAAGTSGEYDVVIRVEDATNSANFAVHQFKLVVTTLAFPTITLPVGNVGTPYNGSLTISGATGVTWTLANFRQMPPGLTFHSDGTVTGTPTARGSFFVQATATDSGGHIRTVGFTVNVYGAGELPPLNLPLGTTFGPVGIGQQTISLIATGGTPPYHYSYTPGATEVPGMRVQDGQPLPTFFATSTTGGLLGVLTTPGTYPTSIRVSDSAGRVFDRPTSIIVSPLQVLTVSPPKATVGVFYSFTLTPYGGTNYAWSASSLPPGLSIDAFGVVSGTPTTAGNFFATIRLTDLPTSTTFSPGITFTVDPFPITTGGVLPQGTVGTAYSQTLTAPGCTGTCTWTWNAGTFFGGLTLSSAGVISGTPTFSGTNSFTATVTGTNGTVSKVFYLAVVPTTPLLLTPNTISFSDFTVGGNATLSLFAQGGTPPYSWSVVAGSLPPGITLQANGEALGASLVPAVSYVIGNLRQAGDYNFTLQVRDAVGAIVTLPPSAWHISPIANSYFSLPGTNQAPLVYNTPYTQPLLAMGGTNSYTFANLDPMPPGLLLNASTGVVSGTPTNTGTVTVRIKETDTAANTFTAFISFNVSGPTTTALNFPLGANLGTFLRGNTQSFNMTPTNGSAPYTITALSALPPGYELIPTAGPAGGMVLTGINTTPGTFNVTIQATDASGNLGVRTFTMVIAPFEVLGVTLTLEDASVGVPYSHAFTLFNGAGVTWAPATGSTLPPGLGISSGGVLSGTPTLAGNFGLRLTATDATSGVAITFALALRVSGIAITGDGILPAAEVGQPYTYAFASSGGGGGAKVWSINTLLPNLQFDQSTGTLSGQVSSAGTFPFVVSVTDGSVPVSRRFLLIATNTIPSELDIALTSTQFVDFTLGQVAGVTISANGGRPPYSFSVAPGSALPAGLRLLSGSELSPGAFSPGTTQIAGVPTVAGPFTVDIIVTDSLNLSTRRTFSGNVKTDAIIGTIPTLTSGTAVAIQLTAVGGPGPFTFSFLSPAPFTDMFPAGVTLSPGGLLSGTPTSTGNFRVLITATDQNGGTITRLFAYTVVNATSQSFVSNGGLFDTALGRRIATNLNVSSFTAAGASAHWTWSVVDALPAGLKLETDHDITNNGTTMLAGQPTAAGTSTFRLRAVNNANAADIVEHVFTLTVTPVQTVFPSSAFPAAASLTGLGGSASYFSLPTGHVGQPYSGTIKLAGGTPPYTIARYMGWPFNGLMPPGMSLNTATGEISGTPTAIGNYFIGLLISDSGGHSSISSARVVVTQPGAPSPLALGFSDTIPGTVGSPFVLPLDLFMSGGEAPYTWTMHSGSTLPLGLAILGGGNGVPMFVAGIPSGAGDFKVLLDVTDADAQTLTVPVDLFFTTIGLSVGSLIPGAAGSPYPSTSLGPFGGVAPYIVDALSDFDMPAGMSMSSGGVISGTPQTAGAFTIVVRVRDAINNEFFKPYLLTIDDAAGEVSSVRLGPNPIQIHYDLGAPTPARVPVGVTSTSGVHAFTLNLTGAPWAALSADSGTTPSTPNLSFNVTGLAVGTYMGVLGVMSPDSIGKLDAAPVILTVTPAPPCTFSVDPTAGSVPAVGGGGSFGVSTGPTCSWTATVSDPSWISITSGSTGKGSRPVSFTALPNAGSTQRVGSIRVNGAVYTLTQFGSACSFAISPSTITTTAAAGTATIGVTASNSSCVWPATSGLGATPAAGTGSGSVGVTIPANPNPGSRQLQATIAGLTLTINQGGAACTTSLDAASASYSSIGGSGSVNVTTLSGCGYSTVLGPSWIHVTSGDSNTSSGALLYTVDPNSTTVGRSGSLVIGGQAYQIAQEPLACSATLDTTGLGNPYGPSGGSGTIGITMNGSNCSWTASSGDSWASVGPAFGTGDGTIVVGIGSNAGSPTGRSTLLAIAGQTVGLAQDGITCSYTLQSATGTAPAGGGSGSVGLSAPAACGWTSAPNDAWLSITSSGSSGTGNVNFVAQPNPLATPRSATLTISPSDPMTPPLVYTVNQGPAPCSYTLALGSITVGPDGGSDNFNFAAGTVGCTPAVQSYASWLHASSPPLVGTSGTVSWTADANTSGASRVGVIQVGTQTFTVTELGGPCAFSLNIYGMTFNAAAHPGNFFLGSPSGLGCTPTPVGVDLPSIVTLGALSVPVNNNNIFTQVYDVSPFIGSATPVYRRAKISFGGTLFIVKQSSW